MSEDNHNIYNPGWRWLGRSLDNYKKLQAKVAAQKGVTEQLKNARTLTEARKICYGVKAKQEKLKK